MNRTDLDALLVATIERLAGESDQTSLDLRAQLATARNELAARCASSAVLERLSGMAREGRNMGRTDDSEVMRVWALADQAQSAPCTPHRERSGDCVYHTAVITRSNHWINGPKSFQPAVGDIVEVWRPRTTDEARQLPTLASRVMDAQYALVEIRNVWPVDKDRQTQGRPPVEQLLPRLVLATQQLEELEAELRGAGL